MARKFGRTRVGRFEAFLDLKTAWGLGAAEKTATGGKGDVAVTLLNIGCCNRQGSAGGLAQKC